MTNFSNLKIFRRFYYGTVWSKTPSLCACYGGAYPELASTFREHRDSPERLMRHSIMKLFLYGDTDIIFAYFGNVPMPNGYPPVGTFLATMTEHLNIQLEFYEMHLEEFDRAAKWPAGLMRKTDEGAENNGKA